MTGKTIERNEMDRLIFDVVVLIMVISPDHFIQMYM